MSFKGYNTNVQRPFTSAPPNLDDDDEDNYAYIYDEEPEPVYDEVYTTQQEHVYEAVTSPIICKKKSRNSHEFNENERKHLKEEEKRLKKLEALKKRISEPLPGSFMHVSRCLVGSNGLQIQGMDMNEVKELIKSVKLTENLPQMPQKDMSSQNSVGPKIYPEVPSTSLHATPAMHYVRLPAPNLVIKGIPSPTSPELDTKVAAIDKLPVTVAPKPNIKPKPIGQIKLENAPKPMHTTTKPQVFAKPFEKANKTNKVFPEPPKCKPDLISKPENAPKPIHITTKPQVIPKTFLKPNITPKSKPELISKPNKFVFQPKPNIPEINAPPASIPKPSMNNTTGNTTMTKLTSYQTSLINKGNTVQDDLRKALLARNPALRGSDDDLDNDDDYDENYFAM